MRSTAGKGSLCGPGLSWDADVSSLQVVILHTGKWSRDRKVTDRTTVVTSFPGAYQFLPLGSLIGSELHKEDVIG